MAIGNSWSSVSYSQQRNQLFAQSI